MGWVPCRKNLHDRTLSMKTPTMHLMPSHDADSGDASNVYLAPLAPQHKWADQAWADDPCIRVGRENRVGRVFVRDDGRKSRMVL